MYVCMHHIIHPFPLDACPRACAAADTRKKFYMEDASHTYRKYKDIRDKCVFYNKDWERSVL